MKKRNFFVILMAIVILLFAIATVLFLKYKQQRKDENINFFQYMINLEHPNYAFAVNGLEYGMTAEEILETEQLQEENWYKDAKFIVEEKTYEDVPFGSDGEKISSLKLEKRYIYEELDNIGFFGANFTIYMDQSYEQAMRELLCEQALEYMPDANAYAADIMKIKTDPVVGWEDLRENVFDLNEKDILGETCCGLKVWINKDGLLEISLSCGLDVRSMMKKYHQPEQNDYDNLFSYALNLSDASYTYAPMQVNYGMSVEEVLEVTKLSEENFEEEGMTIISQRELSNVSEEFDEVGFREKYVFTQDHGLVSVEYAVLVEDSDFESLCNMLYEQAKDCMPKTRNFDIEFIKDAKQVQWDDAIFDEKTGWSTAQTCVSLSFGDAEDGQKVAYINVYLNPLYLK